MNLLRNCCVTWTKQPGCNTAPRDQFIMKVRFESSRQPRGQQQLFQGKRSLVRPATFASLEEGQIVDLEVEQGGRPSVFSRLHGADPTAVTVNAAGGGSGGVGLESGPISRLCPQGSMASGIKLDRLGSAALSGGCSSWSQQKTSVQNPFGSSRPTRAPMTMAREDEPWDGEGGSHGYGNRRELQPRMYNDQGLGFADERFSPDLVAATAEALREGVITQMKISRRPCLKLSEAEVLQGRVLSDEMQEVVKVRWGRGAA